MRRNEAMARFIFITKTAIGAGSLCLALLVLGCSSIPEDQRNPKDPLEPYNRAMHQFNTDFDKTFIKPIAKGYKAVVPEPVDQGITNFFSNIDDVNSAVNNLLQVKISRFGTDIGRLVINTTIGIGGLIDVATNMGLPSYKEDFGQTFGYWGDVDSPYLVLPLLGPSTLRDTMGIPGNIAANPFFHVWNTDKTVNWTMLGLDVIDTRADLLTATDLVDTAATDPYAFVRDAFLQKRRNQIFDGNPPPSPEEEDIWSEEDAKETGPAKKS
jgi:phospholipid-binding lipoprotein MlaA